LFACNPLTTLYKYHARFARLPKRTLLSLNVGCGSHFAWFTEMMKPAKPPMRHKPYVHTPLGNDKIRLLKVSCFADGSVRLFAGNFAKVLRETQNRSTWPSPTLGRVKTLFPPYLLVMTAVAASSASRNWLILSSKPWCPRVISCIC
jgi:hypothetical protein